MQKNRKIKLDFTNSRSRINQRTNEATLVVGKKTSDETGKNESSTIHSINNLNENVKHSKSPLLSKLGKIKGAIENSPETSTANSPKTTTADDDKEKSFQKTENEPVEYKPVTLSVKFHESRTSSDTVIVDPKLIPGAKVGDVGEIRFLNGTKKRLLFVFKDIKNDNSSFDVDNDTGDYLSNYTNTSINIGLNSKSDPKSDLQTNGDQYVNDSHNSTNNVISILLGPIVTSLDLKPRENVVVRVRNKDSVEADTIEMYVKDIHLSRGDMWNISSLLVGRCLYKNEKLFFINGSIRLGINKIYKNGHKFYSGYIGKNTKVVFRSDSARLVVFIQISSEMWHFEESGQQMFHKLVNSFFPKAFQRWKDLGTHHLITIILFSSVDLDGEKIRYGEGETPPNKADYYRVVVDQVHILLWNEIMATLRLEFANFKKDIYLHRNKHVNENAPQEYVIQGSILPAAKGSLLEALNLGMSLVSDDFKDQYLRQTTNHFMFITPGTGLFDVSYDMLIRSSKLMASVDSTVDIICLSQPPLHIVPLFRYLDNQNRLKHCIPNWLDISFWTDSSQAVHQWLPKCKIYELQMMGVMENEILSTNIPNLDLTDHRSVIEAMEFYDKNLFTTTITRKPKKITAKQKPILLQRSSNDRIITAPSYIIPKKSNTASEKKSELLHPSELIVSNNKSSPATCNAFGVTTTSKPNVSAFSQLLSLSQNSETKTATTAAYHFVKKMISTPILNPRNSNPDLTSLNSSSDLQSIDNFNLANSSSKETSSIKSIPTPESQRNSTVSTIGLEIKDNNKSSSILNDVQKSQRNSQRNIKLRNKINAKKERHSKYLEERDSISNSYWTNIGNPSTTLSSELLSMISYGRWRFVFPPNIKRRSIKWKSLSSPASLPLMTTIFPTLTDFNQNYTFRIYDVLMNQDVVNENRTSETLIRKMISLRLTLGFQICIGDKVEKVEKHRKPNGDSKLLIEYLNKENYIGSRVYLSLGNEIHRICCDFNGLLNVQVYKRIASNDEQLTLSQDKEYVENIRTRYSEQYSPVTIKNTSNTNARNYNWNQLDQVLAGYDESIDKQKYHRMKFVILPAAVPDNSFSLTNEKLSTEEIRLEGIRSLIMNIYKIKFRSNEEKKIKKRLEIAPEIYFYTENLFDYLKNESSSMKNSMRKKSLIPESIFSPATSLSGASFKGHQFTKSVDPHKLVAALQSEDGIPIIDRHWHLKFYRYCFLGMDLVDFLIENFEDIETREEAVEYGNKLMSENVFSHVVAKHRFLDGHYFYYLNKKIANDNNNDKHKAENKKEKRSSVDKSYSMKESDSTAKGSETIMLSKEVLCDLDPNGYSWQPELIKVHYDIVHNPEHCFHLRLEWLDTTSKLIEDLINGWSKYCERYGLSLVEIPWEELFILPIRNPLHSTIEITLAIDPWEDREFKTYENIYKKEKYYFHLYLLKRGSFMLDNRTANYFKDDKLDVVYSWGKPMFQYAQFIHYTGGYIAELRNNGNFFLAPNNAHISRLNLNIGKLHNLGKSKAVYFDSQRVMLEFRSICTDESKLRELFREAVKAFENKESVV